MATKIVTLALIIITVKPIWAAPLAISTRATSQRVTTSVDGIFKLVSTLTGKTLGRAEALELLKGSREKLKQYISTLPPALAKEADYFIGRANHNGESLDSSASKLP